MLGNLKVWKVDTLMNLIYVKGSIPGKPGSWLTVIDAKNKKFDKPPPFPTYVVDENTPIEIESEMERPAGYPESDEIADNSIVKDERREQVFIDTEISKSKKVSEKRVRKKKKRDEKVARKEQERQEKLASKQESS